MNEQLLSICKDANKAKYELGILATDVKNKVLNSVADNLEKSYEEIISKNDLDIENGINKGMNQGLLDRLKLTKERIVQMAQGVREVALLDDPIGDELDSYTAANGLKITKIRVPMGVIGIIYESRPNVTVDAFALCFKAGSACILKGGSDAINSNKALVSIIKKSCEENGVSSDAIGLIESTDREVTKEFMQMKEYVDLLIPRGGAGLIRTVVMQSTIPVIETGTGNCHIFVDETADIQKSIDVIINAKTQRIGVCNACESLVVHSKIKDKLLPPLAKALYDLNVEIRGDESVCGVIDCVSATPEDFKTEYLDYIISVKTVDSLEEAIEHINECTTHHSESILTENKENAAEFQKRIDAACVYVNSSTRFTDGFEFGLGAEIGISTQKLHARGPMGLKEITSYKYNITGDYSVRK